MADLFEKVLNAMDTLRRMQVATLICSFADYFGKIRSLEAQAEV